MNKKMIWSVAAIVVIAAGFAMWNGSKKSGDDPGLPIGQERQSCFQSCLENPAIHFFETVHDKTDPFCAEVLRFLFFDFFLKNISSCAVVCQ